jgi:hypothetical protein
MQCLELPHRKLHRASARRTGGLSLADLFGIACTITLDQSGQYRGVVERCNRRGPLVAQSPNSKS